MIKRHFVLLQTIKRNNNDKILNLLFIKLLPHFRLKMHSELVKTSDA